MNKEQENLLSLLSTVKALRGPNGCPWDKEQTHKSLRKYLLEESYEVLEVLDSMDAKIDASLALKEELGDLLFQILLHSELAEEKNLFSFLDVMKNLEEKIHRRHPHVFAGKKISSAKEVSLQWEETKNKEKTLAHSLDNIPNALPALQKAEKVISRVTKEGFQWPDLKGPLDKVAEELSELAEEISKKNRQKEKIEAELGDLFFSLCNVAYFLEISPESALRNMLSRFEKRFRFVEDSIKKTGRKIKDASLEEMDIYWTLAKKIEKNK